MKFYYITFRSVTYAQRAERELQGRGIYSTLMRTPKWMEERGCGYCLRLWTENIRPALQILQKSQLPLRKVYYQSKEGNWEEWSL